VEVRRGKLKFSELQSLEFQKSRWKDIGTQQGRKPKIRGHGRELSVFRKFGDWKVERT
jgi:hypothetical protein